MVRIGVNIPNELMQRLEPLKPELNISQVCREALAAKAEKHERMKAGLEDDEVEAVVDGLWEREKELLAATDLDWEMLGYQDAAAWTKAASWDDWEDILEELRVCQETNWPEWRIVPPTIDGVKWLTDRRGELRDCEERVRQHDRGLYLRLLRRLTETDMQADQREYMTAWISHVKAVWELVKKREIEHLERQLAQRAAPPEPEIPEHLFDDAQSPEEQPFQAVPHHAGYALGVDPLKLNHLSGDLDVAEFLAKRERL